MRKIQVGLLVLLATTVLAAHGGWCAESRKDYKVLTAPEVKQMLESGDVLMVHVLSRIEYNAQHIEGSINIPITEVKNTRLLPKDKSKPIIFYCMGTR